MASAFVVRDPSVAPEVQAKTTRKATNLTLPSDLLARAKALNINVSRASERGLREEIRDAEDRQWAIEHAQFIKNTREWADENGGPLDEYRAF